MIESLQIEYEDPNVKELFDDLGLIQASKNLMKKRIGTDMTKAVKKRYDQIKAANNFAIYLSTGLGKPHSLSGDKLGCYEVHVTANWRLIIQPVSEDNSAESLKNCDSLIIKGVMDYHGNGTNNNWIIP
ncbi:MAG: hypothetical protein WBI07_10640 [Mobilitalea sp.]